MDRREAKSVLQALRPNDLNTADPAVIQALVLVESDPELKAWWDVQKTFDLKVAEKIKDVPIPVDLRDTILAGRKIERITPQPHLSLWLAAAAVVAILCVAGTLKQVAAANGPLAQTEYAATVLPMVNHDAPRLGMTSPDHDKIMTWLKARNAPLGTLPSGLSAIPSVGCQEFVVHGHTVSLICFAMANGCIAHLFIVEQQALSNPPSNTGPEFKRVQGWSTAAWSDGEMSYLLATQAGTDALKQLL